MVREHADANSGARIALAGEVTPAAICSQWMTNGHSQVLSRKWNAWTAPSARPRATDSATLPWARL